MGGFRAISNGSRATRVALVRGASHVHDEETEEDQANDAQQTAQQKEVRGMDRGDERRGSLHTTSHTRTYEHTSSDDRDGVSEEVPLCVCAWVWVRGRQVRAWRGERGKRSISISISISICFLSLSFARSVDLYSQAPTATPTREGSQQKALGIGDRDKWIGTQQQQE